MAALQKVGKLEEEFLAVVRWKISAVRPRRAEMSYYFVRLLETVLLVTN